MLSRTLNILKSPRFQIISVLVTLLYITAVHIWQYEHSFYSEQPRRILPVDSFTKQLSSNISVGLHVNNFPLFSFSKNDFIMDATIWFQFPVGTESLKVIDRFGFENGEILQKSKPIVKLFDRIVVVSYQVKVQFKADLDYHHFPVGDHRLTIVLHNKTVTPNELVFETKESDFELSDDIFVSTWLPVKKEVQAGYARSVLNKSRENMHVSYPLVVFTISFQNHSVRDLITLYFPLFVIFFIGFFSLLVDLRETHRLLLIASSMPLLVLYQIVINNISPPSSGITKVDFIYFLLVFLSLIILLFQAYVVLRMRRIHPLPKEEQEKTVSRLSTLNSLIFIFIIILLLAAITYNVII